jgi:hypothetical protein
MIGMVLRTQCKGVAEEGSDSIDVLKIISGVALKAGPREVGESRCAVLMTDRTLVQNQLKMLYSIIQVRDPPISHVFGESCVAYIYVSSNFAVYEGLQSEFRQQKLTGQSSGSLTSNSAPF